MFLILINTNKQHNEHDQILSHLGNEDKRVLSTDASDRESLSPAVNLGSEDTFSSSFVMIYSSYSSIRLPLKVKNAGDFGVKVAFRNCVVATHKDISDDIITIPIKV